MHIEKLVKIVQGAGAVALEYYSKDVKVELKEDNSPVTEADIAVHKYLSLKLKETDIPILSEEGSHDDFADKDLLWIIDPIDGTKDFIQHTDDFAVMVAIVKNGLPVMSVVYAPAHDKLYYAEKGKGAYVLKGGKKTKLAVSKVSSSSEASVMVSRNHIDDVVGIIGQKLGISNLIKAGSIGVKLGIIAEGNAEIYANSYSSLGWWDVASPQLILEEAGGKVTGMDESEIRYTGNDFHVLQGVLATNGMLHKKVLEVL